MHASLQVMKSEWRNMHVDATPPQIVIGGDNVFHFFFVFCEI